MKKPKWKINFQDFPPIPESKKWSRNGNSTPEQIITMKLVNNQNLSKEEQHIMRELSEFYINLFKSLKDFEYKSLNQKDIENFKRYISYAFNYIVYITNNIEISQLYRVVINQNIIGSKKTLLKKSLLTYPPLHLVSKLNKYNRANTPATTVFYGSESLDTCLNEIKPKIGDILTVGVWAPNIERQFKSYPISHGNPAHGVNLISTKARTAFNEFKKQHDQLLVDFIEIYFNLLGSEFSKLVTHHYEYIISALFSEKILYNKANKNTDFDVECISYPSVGNNYITSNIAFRKDIFRNNFKLINVIEFEVTDLHFERPQSEHPEKISLVDFKNLKQTNNIKDNEIIW